jgi:riboflavin synthase
VFTGLIASIGCLEETLATDDGATLRISTSLAAELDLGDSIAVDGVCLTAIRVCEGECLEGGDVDRGDVRALSAKGLEGGDVDRGAVHAREAEGLEVDDVDRGGVRAREHRWFEAHAINETLRRSTLGSLAVGDPVNLELALRADARLGGHVVQGHVDGIATVAAVRDDGFSRVIALDLPAELLPLVVEKGSIALAGVSLTVSALLPAGIEVSLIPETLSRTTLGRAAAGDAVNVEVDILAKHVQRLLACEASLSSDP